MKQCLICDKKAWARGYCGNHYYKMRKNGTIQIIQHHEKVRGVCSVDNCNKITVAKQLCNQHYRRLHKKGTVKLKKEILIDKSTWSKENIAWLAGIIEGEGNLDIRKSSNSCRIRVRMTDFDVIDKIQQIVNHGTVNGPYFRKNPKHKPSKEWSLNRSSIIIELLPLLMPWLLSRRRNQALLMLERLGKNAY